MSISRPGHKLSIVKTIGLIVLICLVVTFWVRKPANATTWNGKPAPEFSLPTGDGQIARLSEQKGKVVVLDFWATWCGPCQESLPHTQSLSADAARVNKGLVVWAVDDAEAPADISRFLADNHYTFSVPMDARQSVMQAYHVDGIPAVFVIGRDGIIKKEFDGYYTGVGQEIDAAVDRALAEPVK